ncbi:unnamed protein product [Trifolium pratense]|uniref:Uncharacterized protein n=1 Tax=Trifolium pratense TaxID=57577 RepID=A0ACB0K4E0_TRIPR|nr:unnamed protein product [Trifolium pratense]
MAFVEKALVLLMMIMVAAQVSNAADYKVGDSAGWTTKGDINYKKWAAEKQFKINDTIIFEYNAQFHNVMRVKNHAVYMKCDASAPLETYTTGNDTIKLTHYGHHFFMCGIPGHCQLGQRVDINVPNPAKSPSPPTTSPSAPTKSPSPPTTSPSAPTPPTKSPSAPTSPTAPAPAKSPSASDSPAPVSNTPSPSPSRSNASPLNVGKGAYGFVGLAITVFAIFYI